MDENTDQTPSPASKAETVLFLRLEESEVLIAATNSTYDQTRSRHEFRIVPQSQRPEPDRLPDEMRMPPLQRLELADERLRGAAEKFKAAQARASRLRCIEIPIGLVGDVHDNQDAGI